MMTLMIPSRRGTAGLLSGCLFHSDTAFLDCVSQEPKQGGLTLKFGKADIDTISAFLIFNCKKEYQLRYLNVKMYVIV